MYVIFVEPAPAPVTTPEEFTDATPPLEDDQVYVNGAVPVAFGVKK